MAQPPITLHPPNIPDPVTPTHTSTPSLSSTSPETPTNRHTPHHVQTPRMKGYSRIGVGVRPDVDKDASSEVPVLSSGETIVQTESEKNEGLGYGIELDEYDLKDMGLDRGEGSSSSSTREVILAAPSAPHAPEQDQPTTPTELVETTEVEMPDIAELRRISDRLSASAGNAERDELVGMVCPPREIYLLLADIWPR